MIAVKISKRTRGGYRAAIKDTGYSPGYGESPKEALGDLIQNYAEKFAIEITRTWERGAKKPN